MNVRLVHAALWRETAEPHERRRGLPWYLRRLYAVMFILAVVYLLTQTFDWQEYEDSAPVKQRREQARQQQRAALYAQGAQP